MKKVDSVSEFKNQMLKASTYTKKDIERILKKVTVDAFRELIMRSAKKSGYLRSKWDVSVDQALPNTKLKNPNPKGSYQQAQYPSKEIKYDSVIVIYNNTEYAIYLETGTPFMAAQPMVEPVSRSVEAKLDVVVKQLSKEVLDV